MNGVEAHGINEGIERMLKRFKRLSESTAIVAEMRDKMYFEKPSVIKRRKIKEAIRKQKNPHKFVRKDREQRDEERDY